MLFAKRYLLWAVLLGGCALSAGPIPLETVTVKGAKIEDGVVSRSVGKSSYCVLEFQLKEPIPFSVNDVLSMEFKAAAKDPKAMVIAQLKIGKKATWAGFPVTGEWQKRKVPFASTRYESAFGGKRPEEGEMITGLKFYCRSPQKEAMTLQLKNISIDSAAGNKSGKDGK